MWPSCPLALAKPACHTLTCIKILKTGPLHTDPDQVFHCVCVKRCSSIWLDPLLCGESSLTNGRWHGEDQQNVDKMQYVLKNIQTTFSLGCTSCQSCFYVKVDLDFDIKMPPPKKQVKPCTLNSMALWLTLAPKGWGRSCPWTSWQLTASGPQTLLLPTQC